MPRFCPYKTGIKHREEKPAEMSALANHAFVKMNGLGNEIVVVDLRVPPGAPAAANRAASKVPAYSYSTGPVIST